MNVCLLIQVEIAKDEDDDEELPLTYDPEAIAAYWDRRPVSIITRVLQLLGKKQSDVIYFISAHFALCEPQASLAASYQS